MFSQLSNSGKEFEGFSPNTIGYLKNVGDPVDKMDNFNPAPPVMKSHDTWDVLHINWKKGLLPGTQGTLPEGFNVAPGKMLI